MSGRKTKLFYNPLFVSSLLVVLTFIITVHIVLLNSKMFGSCPIEYTHYNNYMIFKQSFFHLIENKDLYQLYPMEHWDLFKYSPTFSLLMAPLVYLPDFIGLFVWNLLNVLILFFALWKLPLQTDKSRLFILAFILIELITSVQNSQSNGLIAGLIIFAFVLLQRKQIALASLFIVLTVFIKLFGILAFLLFIFYSNKLRAILYTIGWTLLLAVLPLIIVSLNQLLFLYNSWFNLLLNDESLSWGISVSGLFHSWFAFDNKNLILIFGLCLFCLPLFKYKFFKEIRFRLFFLSSILLWITIFNHKAESPTFVIAVSGAAIWFFSQKLSALNLILLIVAFILTILSPTDIFPKTIRLNYIVPYTLKVLPCILIWIKITFDMFFYTPLNNQTTNFLM